MTKAIAIVSTLFLFVAPRASAQPPAGFAWVNMETDRAAMAAVRRSLHDPSVTAIREVGIQDGFALVMTASRDKDAPTPDYDQWKVYSLDLASGKSQPLAFGYGLQIIDWIGPKGTELAISYYDCWECEAATLFTVLRFEKAIGWQARWENETSKEKYPQPGVVVEMTDIGDPYDDDDVDQVFAVVGYPNNVYSVGRWTHSRNSKTGALRNDVEKYSIDPVTGKDQVQKLTGQAALVWEREICTQEKILIKPSIGQDSKACKSVLRKAAS
jgi:hypothetical protein